MSTDDEEYADLLAALQASGTANAPRNSDGIYMSICDEAATALERLSAERDAAMEALEPLARLGLPKRPQGNAGFYSIRHNDISRARAALRKMGAGR
ncbi:MAG: hypothetical protein ACTHOR_01815 [Devosia sp.]